MALRCSESKPTILIWRHSGHRFCVSRDYPPGAGLAASGRAAGCSQVGPGAAVISGAFPPKPAVKAYDRCLAGRDIHGGILLPGPSIDRWRLGGRMARALIGITSQMVAARWGDWVDRKSVV